MFVLLGLFILVSGDAYCQDRDAGFAPSGVDKFIDGPSGLGKARPIEAPEIDIPSAILKGNAPNLITQTVALTLVALMPFVIMLLTSFVKIVIVLSLLRNALGAQQAPPNQVINGVALLLSIYIMYPTGVKMYQAAEPMMQKRDIPNEMVSAQTAQYVIDFVDTAKEPFRDFMIRNSSPKHHRSFHRIAYNLLPPEYRDGLGSHDFIVVIPSYITGQLKSAFEIGVLIYIPFFVIDLVTSNILLAMGMMMLSPVTISMPLKLFLLVMLDGWTLLVQGLVGTFV
jgi:type III secretion protein R